MVNWTFQGQSVEQICFRNLISTSAYLRTLRTWILPSFSFTITRQEVPKSQNSTKFSKPWNGMLPSARIALATVWLSKAWREISFPVLILSALCPDALHQYQLLGTLPKNLIIFLIPVFKPYRRYPNLHSITMLLWNKAVCLVKRSHMTYCKPFNQNVLFYQMIVALHWKLFLISGSPKFNFVFSELWRA